MTRNDNENIQFLFAWETLFTTVTVLTYVKYKYYIYFLFIEHVYTKCTKMFINLLKIFDKWNW